MITSKQTALPDISSRKRLKTPLNRKERSISRSQAVTHSSASVRLPQIPVGRHKSSSRRERPIRAISDKLVIDPDVWGYQLSTIFEGKRDSFKQKPCFGIAKNPS